MHSRPDSMVIFKISRCARGSSWQRDSEKGLSFRMGYIVTRCARDEKQVGRRHRLKRAGVSRSGVRALSFLRLPLLAQRAADVTLCEFHPLFRPLVLFMVSSLCTLMFHGPCSWHGLVARREYDLCLGFSMIFNTFWYVYMQLKVCSQLFKI